MNLVWLVFAVFLLALAFGCGNSSERSSTLGNASYEPPAGTPITSSDESFSPGEAQPASAPRAGAEDDHDRPISGAGLGATARSTSPTTGETNVASAASPMCGGPDDPCEERDVSAFVLFGIREGAAAYSVEEEVASVEDVLTRGLRLMGASPVHIALRGAAQSNSIRCDLRGIARTADQREAAIRFWLELDDDDPLPSALEVERRRSRAETV